MQWTSQEGEASEPKAESRKLKAELGRPEADELSASS
jgi:hypothetical protein